MVKKVNLAFTEEGKSRSKITIDRGMKDVEGREDVPATSVEFGHQCKREIYWQDASRKNGSTVCVGRMLVTPALGRLTQEDHHEFEA